MKTPNKSKNNIPFLLVFIVVFGIALRLAFPVGIVVSGDLVHLKYAIDIAKGNYNPTAKDPSTATRIGFIYPTALFFKILGINEFSAYIFPLIMSIASILLVYFLGKLFFNEKTALAAAFLMSFFPLSVNYSTQAFPDLPQAFFMALSVLFFFYGEKSSSKKNQILFHLFTGISAGIAYSMKQSGILIFLFFGIYIMYNLFYKKQKFKASYFLIFVGALFMIFLYSLHDYLVSGDPLLAYRQLDTDYVAAVKNVYNYKGYKLFERLFFHIPYMMLTNVNFGFFGVFALMALSYIIIYKKKNTVPVALWLIVLFLYLNFGTTSLSQYLPLPGGAPRYMDIISIPAILVIAFFLTQEDVLIKKMMLPFTLIFLLFTSIAFIYINPDRNSIASEKQIGEFLKAQKPLKIYADGRTKTVLSFLYENKFDMEIYWIGKYPYTGSETLIKSSDMKNAYVIINKSYFNRIPQNYLATFPDIYYNAPKNWKLIKTIKNPYGDVLIYYAS